MGAVSNCFLFRTHRHTYLTKMRVTLAIVITLMSFFSSTQARFTEEQIENLAFNLLNPCERAIWSCCQSDRPTSVQPTFCFERNGCFGLQWLGQNACSTRLINSIGVTLESTKAQIRRKAPTQDGGFIRILHTRPKK